MPFTISATLWRMVYLLSPRARRRKLTIWNLWYVGYALWDYQGKQRRP